MKVENSPKKPSKSASGVVSVAIFKDEQSDYYQPFAESAFYDFEVPAKLLGSRLWSMTVQGETKEGFFVVRSRMKN